VEHDIDQLLAQAPEAVDSYFPGHWQLMRELERRARQVVANEDLDAFVKFLRDVAFLKQPRSDHQWLLSAIQGSREDAAKALGGLRDIDRLDYRAMDLLASVPGFGQRGGRAFNSAVVRLARPESFGIIDWRNLAVLMSASGFEGLMEPPIRLRDLSPDEVLRSRGNLILTQKVYEHYNNALRAIAREHRKSVAEIDIVLWTFSIHKRPFSPFIARQSKVQGYRITPDDRRLLRTAERNSIAAKIVRTYIAGLSEAGDLSSTAAIDELCSVFALVRDECNSYAQTAPRVRQRARRVIDALRAAIESRSLKRLLSLWGRWNDFVNPASPSWIGIDLPGSMVLGGFMILEDFLEVKQFFERYGPSKV
jgi:hypothetical protein